MRDRFEIALVCMLACFVGGCASTIHGAEQMVTIVSNPPGATVFVNDVRADQATPTTIALPRDTKAVVRLESNGYASREVSLGRGVSAWLLMNLGLCGMSGGQAAESGREAAGVFLGCVGILTGIDLLSGGAYTLQKRVSVELMPDVSPAPGASAATPTSRPDRSSSSAR
jgi:hypothetical protein